LRQRCAGKMILRETQVKKTSKFVDFLRDAGQKENRREFIMSNFRERRKEQRLNYHWPVWFGPSEEAGLVQGQMSDVSSEGAMFTCYGEDGCAVEEQQITASFSVPIFGPDESYTIETFSRGGKICRVEQEGRFSRRVAVKFAEPLPVKPGEQLCLKRDFSHS